MMRTIAVELSPHRINVNAIEPGWIDAFAEVFTLCKIRAEEQVVLLAESQSRPLNRHEVGAALGTSTCCGWG